MDELGRELVTSLAKLALFLSDIYETASEAIKKYDMLDREVEREIPTEATGATFRTVKPVIIATFSLEEELLKNHIICLNRNSVLNITLYDTRMTTLISSALHFDYKIRVIALAKLIREKLVIPTNEQARKYHNLVVDKAGKYADLVLVREVDEIGEAGEPSIWLRDKAEVEKIINSFFSGKELNRINIDLYIHHSFDTYAVINMFTREYFSNKPYIALVKKTLSNMSSMYFSDTEVKAGIEATNLSAKQIILLSEKLL